MIGLVLFDLQNVIAWWRGRVLDASLEGDEDFTILVPVYGNRKYFEERSQLERWKDHVVVILEVSSPDMRAFSLTLKADGWRVFTCVVATPSPPRLILEALRAGVVKTTYVLRMDGDTRPIDDISRYVAEMRRDGADLSSVKVYVADPSTSAQRFQALEYRMSMLSRHFRPHLTSGACYVAKTGVLRAILERHSFWSVGEDVETGRIANALKLRIRHLDMRVLTDAPASWKALLKQRRLWWAGNFRHTWVNFDKNVLHMPVWTFYYAALVWVGIVFKGRSLSAFVDWRSALVGFVAMWILYAGIALVGNLPVASWRMLVYPPYALLQAILMPTVGIVYFTVLSRRLGGFGRYRFGYRRRPLPVRLLRPERRGTAPAAAVSVSRTGLRVVGVA